MNGKSSGIKTLSPTVIASFVLVDRIGQSIEGVTVKAYSRTINKVATTDDKGHAFTIENAPRGEEISILVKKKSGIFEFKGKVTPKKDVNAYTIQSPELHIEATTQLTSKEELEQDLVIPTIKEGETMTIARLLDEFAPYMNAAVKITEVGKIVKFINDDKPVNDTKNITEKPQDITNNRQYKVITTEKPKTISFNLLSTAINYPNKSISDDTYKQFAAELKCEPAALKAVATTESGNGGFLQNGLPKIMFERHKFYMFTDPNKIKDNTKKASTTPIPHPFSKFPDICHPTPGGHRAENLQYTRLIKAAKLDKDAAIMACSWGGFQVLAEYYKQCGYNSPEDLANECMKTEEAHFKLFYAFLCMPEKKKAVEALRNKDWEQFATYYNGSNWRKQNPLYAQRMADHYEIFN